MFTVYDYMTPTTLAGVVAAARKMLNEGHYEGSQLMLAVNAGNASGANLAMPGQNYLAGMQGVSGTVMQGAGMGIQGSLGILNGPQAQNNTGQVIGGIAGIAGAVL
jgi:hypothetical protein